jgi:hypothetical protein
LVNWLAPADVPLSGAIGAACEVPETAAKSNAATAIAKTVLIVILLKGANLRHSITHRHDGGSTTTELPHYE